MLFRSLLTGRPQAGAEDGVDWVRSLVSDLPISGLGLYGMKKENIAELAAKAAQASSMKANPIVLTPAELSALLEEAL